MNKFYVYGLYRDFDCTEVFYIGKGVGSRLMQHEKEFLCGMAKNRRKAALIKICLAKFRSVPKMVFAKGLSSQEAYELEMELIAKYGRLDLGTGVLTNLTDGGDGANNVSDETKARMSARALANGSRPPSRRGVADSEETRRKKKEAALRVGNRPPLRNGPFSEEHKNNLSKAAKGRPGRKNIPWSESRRAAYESSREINRLVRLNRPKRVTHNKGKPASEGQKEKQRLTWELKLSSGYVRKFTPEHCANIGRGRKGKGGTWSEKRRKAYESSLSSEPTSPPLELAKRRLIRGLTIGELNARS